MFVLMPVEGPRWSAVFPGWNYRCGAPVCDGLDQDVGIVGLVRDHGLRREVFDQDVGLGHVVDLPARQCPACQLTQAFDQRVNLGGQSTPRAAERLIARVF